MNHIKTVAVTGAAGLIGSAIVRLLLERGVRVIALDDFTIGAWREKNSGITWVQTDISEPQAAAALDQHAPDVVVHCAAHPGGKSLKEPVLDVRVNALGSMRIFDWCARAKKPVIFLSTSGVYGEQPRGPISEDAPIRPGKIYAISKVACENFLATLGKGCGLSWTVLRVFATYGAGHRPSTFQGILNVMLTQLQAGDRVVVRGELERERDMIYADDTADAVVRAVFSPQARGRIINVGTGRAVTVRAIIAMIAAAIGKDPAKIELVEEPREFGDPMYSVASAALAHEILGFTAKTSIQEGIDRLLRQRATAPPAES
ncbi:MAG: NAD-dependent epimerase/dehydratase family protein [Elusimicrobiota bacterium]